MPVPRRLDLLDSVHEWFATLAATTASEVIVMDTLSALYDRRMREAKTTSNLLRHVAPSLSLLL